MVRLWCYHQSQLTPFGMFALFIFKKSLSTAQAQRESDVAISQMYAIPMLAEHSHLMTIQQTICYINEQQGSMLHRNFRPGMFWQVSIRTPQAGPQVAPKSSQDNVNPEPSQCECFAGNCSGNMRPPVHHLPMKLLIMLRGASWAFYAIRGPSWGPSLGHLGGILETSLVHLAPDCQNDFKMPLQNK